MVCWDGVSGRAGDGVSCCTGDGVSFRASDGGNGRVGTGKVFAPAMGASGEAVAPGTREVVCREVVVGNKPVEI